MDDRQSGLHGFRVGLVTENPIDTLGGVERFSLSLVKELERRGAEVHVYDRTLLSSFQPRWYDRYGVGPARRMHALGWAVAKLLRDSPVDVLIQNGISGWSLRRATPRLPRIVVHHGTWRGVAPHLVKLGDPLRTRVANRVVVSWGSGAIEKWTSAGAQSVGVSASVVQELEKLYGLKAVAIQNGIDTERFSPRDRTEARRRLGLEANSRRVLVAFTGRLEHRKGQDILRALAERSQSTFPDVGFLVATDGKPSDWPPNVAWLEKVPYEQMPLVYAASDIFLFPSRYEGCSYSLIEAMACGCAPLVSSVGHAQDIQRDSASLRTFVLDQVDMQSFWPSLGRLVADADLRSRLGAAARQYALEHNSLAAMGDAYQELILSLAGGTQPNAGGAGS